jgi:hypothetical protein
MLGGNVALFTVHFCTALRALIPVVCGEQAVCGLGLYYFVVVLAGSFAFFTVHLCATVCALIPVVCGHGAGCGLGLYYYIVMLGGNVALFAVHLFAALGANVPVVCGIDAGCGLRLNYFVVVLALVGLAAQQANATKEEVVVIGCQNFLRDQLFALCAEYLSQTFERAVSFDGEYIGTLAFVITNIHYVAADIASEVIVHIYVQTSSFALFAVHLCAALGALIPEVCGIDAGCGLRLNYFVVVLGQNAGGIFAILLIATYSALVPVVAGQLTGGSLGLYQLIVVLVDSRSSLYISLLNYDLTNAREPLVYLEGSQFGLRAGRFLSLGDFVAVNLIGGIQATASITLDGEIEVAVSDIISDNQFSVLYICIIVVLQLGSGHYVGLLNYDLTNARELLVYLEGSQFGLQAGRFLSLGDFAAVNLIGGIHATAITLDRNIEVAVSNVILIDYQFSVLDVCINLVCFSMRMIMHAGHRHHGEEHSQHHDPSINLLKHVVLLLKSHQKIHNKIVCLRNLFSSHFRIPLPEMRHFRELHVTSS